MSKSLSTVVFINERRMIGDTHYRLVLETIRDLEDTRKVWRMVNGVLLEKSKGEIVPEVKTEIANMDNVCDQISGAL